MRARATAVIGARVVAFCSAECKAQGSRPAEAREGEALGRPNRFPLRLLALASGAVVLAGVLLGARVRFDERAATAALPARGPADQPALLAVPPAEPPVEEKPFGPEPPPPDFFREGEAWFHPLPGPVRRLPERPSRRFGVERGHDSPESCRQGHCGIDIGELRGETVLAVHDGVVERVVRDENAPGGRYVRLLHLNGTVVTQYMHLDGVADLKPGQRVRAGDAVGTVGDTGVKNAGPHLHFTVATRRTDTGAETYIDPEPLVTLWPMAQR